MTDAGFECIDGQHTAIAAASHPDIEKILVVVVDATEQAARASAKQMAALTSSRDKLKARADHETARADNAERLARDTSRELQRWKDRALRAEATVASAGLNRETSR